MEFQLLPPRDQLVAVMNRIYHNGMTTLSGGNLSVRDDNGDIWITPSGVDKGQLTAKDIMVIRGDGWIEGPHKAYATFPFLAAQGGVPIIIDGELIGAIGVSGVKSFQDEQIALAAIRAVFPQATTTRPGEENDASTV